MSSGFISGGTIDNPTERDDEWRAAQAELEEKRRLKAIEHAQHDGKSLYEVLQANKAAKQDAFEEANRLKNQYRALDDDEADFLDSVLQETRHKEAEIRKANLEELDKFRRRQEEAEAKALEVLDADAPEAREAQAHWTSTGTKRKKGHELLKGVKLRRGSSTNETTKASQTKDDLQKLTTERSSSLKPITSSATSKAALLSEASPKLSSHAERNPQKVATEPISLAIGYESSDDD